MLIQNQITNPSSNSDAGQKCKRAVIAVSTCSHMNNCLTMLASVGAHNPNVALICCLADSMGVNTCISVNSGINIHLVGASFFASPQLAKSTNYYDPLEYCCAAKASALRYALVKLGFDQVFYIDSDCFCFGSLASAFEQLAETTVLLTPHFLAGGRRLAAESDCYGLVQVGFLNAGTIGFSNNRDALAILDWLDDKTTRYGFNCVDACLFLDQTWVSLLPLNFPDHVLIARLPGFNVGPWFLRHRSLTEENGVVHVDGSPLSLFHFTGFDVGNEDELTRFTYEPLTPNANRIVRILLQKYALQLRALTVSIDIGAPDVRLPRRDLQEKVSLYHACHGDSYFYRTFRLVAQRRILRKPPGEKFLRAFRKINIKASRILRSAIFCIGRAVSQQ